MPRPVRDDDDDFDEDELPEGVYHDDELPTVACPHCGGEVLEDSPRCPHCERYLSREDVPAQPRSWFWGVMMAIALVAALWWVLR
jgi:hypothetical protein